jgi:hypothetical protein
LGEPFVMNPPERLIVEHDLPRERKPQSERGRHDRDRRR